MAAVSILLTILWGLAWVLVSLVVLLLILLLLILFLPFDIDLRLDSDWAAPAWEEEMTGAARWRSSLQWGRFVATGIWEGEQLTLSRSEVRVCGIRLRSRPGRQKARPARPKRKRTRKLPDLDLILAVVQQAARFMGHLVRVAGVRVQGDITYGFDDPSLTGFCEVFLGPWRNLVPVHLVPNFTRAALIGWAHVDGRIYGYQVVEAAWRALDDPVIRGRLAEKIGFKPIRYWLLRGGKRQWRTSS